MTDAESSYRPHADGRPDPGEVCWAWVPFEDDPQQGKDRPVLVIDVRGAGGDRADRPGQVGQPGRTDSDRVVECLTMTSKDHDRDAAQEAAAGRHWMDVGSGGWDREGRPSEVRLDRLLTLREGDVRREGAALDRDIFDAVLRAREALR